MPRNPMVPDSLIQERIEYSVKLRQMGLSMTTILERINGLSPIRGWGVISVRQLRRDFATYYRDNICADSEETEELRAMRELFLQRMERHLELLSNQVRYLKGKNPVAFVKGIKTLFDMTVRYAQIQGWDSPKSTTVPSVQDQFAEELEEFKRTGDELSKLTSEQKQGLLDELDALIEGKSKDPSSNNEPP